ncbi:MAG: 50S ribosomal protein L10 [Magnetococcales bacterium]|nr:50S ribosomal protein L10 [Magnetococcales bacterium]
MNRNQKEQVIAEVRSGLETSSVAYVTHYRGLNVDEMTELRSKMRETGAKMRVVKNTLTKRAIKGTDFEPITDLLEGPTAITWSDDPAGPAKVLTEFAKDHDKLVVLGGVLDGNALQVSEIEALAKLPSREVLLAQLMGVMNGPVQGIVNVLSAVPGGFVRALDQIRQQKEEAA